MAAKGSPSWSGHTWQVVLASQALGTRASSWGVCCSTNCSH